MEPLTKESNLMTGEKHSSIFALNYVTHYVTDGDVTNKNNSTQNYIIIAYNNAPRNLF